MKKLIAILVLTLIVGCGGQARAAMSVDHVFMNVSGSTSTTRPIYDLGKVSIQVAPPTFTNASSAVDIAVSADGGLNYPIFKTYSGVAATASGIYDITTQAATHVKVIFRQKKKVHNYRTTTVNMNSR